VHTHVGLNKEGRLATFMFEPGRPFAAGLRPGFAATAPLGCWFSAPHIHLHARARTSTAWPAHAAFACLVGGWIWPGRQRVHKIQVITSEDCHVPYNALLEIDKSSHDGSRHGLADVCVHSVYSDSASMEV
jgi:hypothetical protein